MNLILDIGNTMAKACIALGDALPREVLRQRDLTVRDLEKLHAAHPFDRSILSSTRAVDPAVEEFLCGKGFCLRLKGDTPTPLKNLYRTPETLGPDRLAAAVGAWSVFPGENLLVIDFGTAITIDAVTAEGEYLGGNISPGVHTRFRSLNTAAHALPLRELPPSTTLYGTNSHQAIENGVVKGILYEIEGYISHYKSIYPGLKIIFDGGDAFYFAKQLKNPIFADYDPVVRGLNAILEFNAKRRG